MNKFNAITLVALICRGGGVKTALIAAVAAIAIAAALLGGGLHSQVYADSPSGARASQSPDDASQALRRYALQLLHILSNPDANLWERYRQVMPHCAAAPARLAEIGADSDSNPFDAALIALTQDLCADLDIRLARRLDDARTVGLLVNEPEAMPGYALIPGGLNNDVHLIDQQGRVAHSWKIGKHADHARLLDNGNLLVGYNSGRGQYAIIGESDPDSNIVWKYRRPYPVTPDTFHHDFLKMPNGNVLILAEGIKTKQEAVEAGANPELVHADGLKYDYLIEVRPTGSEGGEIVWEWSTWDYLVQDFDSSKENYGDPSEHPELIDINFRRPRSERSKSWLHTNGIDYNPELDQIALSPRDNSELWIIDHSASTEEAATRKGGNSGKGGALLYRWGNPRAYGHGTIDDQQLFRQHHTQWITPGYPGEGNILIFNNGLAHQRDRDRNYSSIEEIVPPVDGYGYRREPGAAYPPTEPVWSYTAETPTDFYSSVVSGVQRLPNGNTLICEGTQGNVFQVTPDGKTVWQYVYPMAGDTPLKQGERPSIWQGGIFNNGVYRAYWYAPDYPGLQKYDLTPGDTIELYE